MNGEFDESGGLEDLPYDHRLDRFQPVVRGMHAALLLVGALAVGGAMVPGRVGRWMGAGAIAVLVAAPLLRVMWLVRRWVRRGDPRFAAVGCGVLAIVAAGVLLAAVTG